MMKVSIIYYSKTGKTQLIAEKIKAYITVDSKVEVRLMDVENIEKEFLEASQVILFGTPTYYANCAWEIKKWFDTSWGYNLEGKLGGVFVTGDYIGGGTDTALLTIINHMMVKGMLVYSGGSALGQPYLHMGLVILKNQDDRDEERIQAFATRIRDKAYQIFNA